MKMRTYLLVAALPLALAACGSSGGGDSEQTTTQEVHATTTGQELTDLKNALDQGVITQEEYEEQRQKILDRD